MGEPLSRDLLMLMPMLTTAIPMPMELTPMLTAMLLLFPSDPAPVLTPSPRDLMPSPRELPSPTTLARGPLMLMLTTATPTPMELTPMLTAMLLLFPSDPAPVLTPSPRDSMPLPRELPSPTTLARGPLMPMLMLTTATPMPMELTPMLTDPTPMELILMPMDMLTASKSKVQYLF